VSIATAGATAKRARARLIRTSAACCSRFAPSRNTKLIDGLERQISAVRDALSAAGHPDVPIRGALCFTKPELPLLGTRKIRGHRLLGRRALAKTLNSKGALTPTTIDALAQALAGALTPA
jgi:hypothetical protein